MGIPLVILALILGFLLIAKGWPRRRGNDPHCRACDYLLIGMVSDRCPECGGPITPQTTVRGERVRRDKFLVNGIAVILLTMTVLIVGFTNNIQWYHYEPAYFVMRDLHSGIPATETAALTELLRRDQAGSLSPKYRDMLVAEALKQQMLTAPGPNTGSLVRYLGQKCLANGLSPQQSTQFLRQMAQRSLSVRTPIAPGDPVPYRVVWASLFEAGNFWGEFKVDGGTVDGNLIDKNGGGGSQGLNWLSAWERDEFTVPSQSPGRHVLGIVSTIDVYTGPIGQVSAAKLLFHDEQTLSAPFEVLTDRPAGYFKLTDDPALTGRIKASIRPGTLTFAKSGYLMEDIMVTNVPANVAFDIFVRFNGNEYPLRYVVFRKGQTGGSGVGAQMSQPPATADIIFRSSEARALQTTDLNEIWKGEIVYPNIPVTVRPN